MLVRVSRAGPKTLRRQQGVWIYSELHNASTRPHISQLNLFQCRRSFHSSQNFRSENQESFGSRLKNAWNKTEVKWYPIPVGLGIGFLGFAQFLRIKERERRKEEAQSNGSGGPNGDGDQPPKRKRIRPSGPWQVQVMSTLPLKAMSRLWGQFNELEIPYYLRVPGFKLYSWIFGVNLSEVAEPDLHTYPNLASFFYRELKPGVRPLDTHPAAIVSPSDGRILQFGVIQNGEVEQVKGMTYSLDALLGHAPSTSPNPAAPENIFGKPNDLPQSKAPAVDDAGTVKAEEEFANMNGISYTVSDLFTGGKEKAAVSSKGTMDASTSSKSSSEAAVRADLALDEPAWYEPAKPNRDNALYYVVIYLAPGDYHRFHSPVPWVVERRRHFAGELFSVSPYLQRTLPGLFTLNERVVLLGRWRWGFFSYTPVGATNVGSIKINFDKELRTNSLTTDTMADKAAAEAAARGEPYSGFAEATYEHASKVLKGHALRPGEEMGGFQLGSSIVLVFEAPKGKRKSFDEGWQSGERQGACWEWNVEKGARVKMGQALGWVRED